MEISKAAIETTVKALEKHFDLTVDTGNTLFSVYADTPTQINEFESRLVAEVTGAEEVPVFLNELVDFTDHRSRFEPMVKVSGFWVATYSNLTLTD
jgi:hypothetical protein